MKKSIILLLGLFLLTGCAVSNGGQPVNPEPEKLFINDKECDVIYEGEMTEQVVIDAADKDYVVGLRNASAYLEDSVFVIESAKSVTFVLAGENRLESFGYVETTAPSVIRSNANLNFQGDGILFISSTDTCINTKENIKIDSGTYYLNAGNNVLQANESIDIQEGIFNLSGKKIIETTQLNISGGTFNLIAGEIGIDLITKSARGLRPSMTMQEGYLQISRGANYVEGINSMGDLIINGGIMDIDVSTAFTYDGSLSFNGGTVIINGEPVDTIENHRVVELPDIVVPEEYPVENYEEEVEPAESTEDVATSEDVQEQVESAEETVSAENAG